MSKQYNVRKLTDREHYAVSMGSLVLKQNQLDGDNTSVTVQIRRVVPSSGEELQIEIETFKRGEKRNTRQYTSLVLPPEFADAFAKACVAIIEPMDGATACEAARQRVTFNK